MRIFVTKNENFCNKKWEFLQQKMRILITKNENSYNKKWEFL